MKKIIISAFLTVFGILSMLSQQTVYEVKIEGNKRTKTAFLKRLALTKQGTILDTTIVQGDVRRLKLLASVADADYTITTNDAGQPIVTYKIVENFTLIPGLRISTDNNGEFAFRTSLFEFNLGGTNQLVGAFYQRDVFDSYGAFWEAPYLFTRKLGIGLRYDNLVSQEPVFFQNNNEVNYRFNSRAFQASVIYEHNFNNRFELGINIAKEDYQFIEGNLPNGFSLDLDANKLALLGEYEYNNIHIDYQYKEGFRSILNARLVTGGNEFLRNTFIGFNDFEYFKRIKTRGNWANRLRLAYATNDDTPFAPFTVDNQLNIRGAGNTIDRGTAAIVLNTEYRHTLYEKGWFAVQSNVFIDAGSWRNPGGNLGELFDGSTVRFHPGAGIRFIHKKIFNAVFRLDYGYGIGKKATNGIVFGIGQYF
jgi:outer membrane protein assembly factor BamA